jgi:uncharacterized membrane protein
MAKPGWGTLFMVPVFLLAASPHDPRTFWINVGIALPMELIAALMFNKSVQLAPLSLSVPYLAFTPVFLLILEWIFFPARPTMQGVAGILLVTAGAFLLQMETISWAYFMERGIFPREKGPLLMLGVACIFSVTTIFAKRALDASNPMYFSSVYFALIALGLAPLQFRVPGGWKLFFTQPKQFFPLGFAEASGFLMQFIAMRTVEAAYVIAIKRLSLLLSVFYGWLFFKEENLRSRLLGAGVMALGAILIAFA